MKLQSGKENPIIVMGCLPLTYRGKNVGGIPVLFKDFITQDLYLCHLNYSTFVAASPGSPVCASGVRVCTGRRLQQRVGLPLTGSVRSV